MSQAYNRTISAQEMKEEKPRTGRDSRRRSLLKSVSWRITGSLDTLLLCYIFTGSFGLAASISATEVVTKIVLFYLHERVWFNIPFGR